MSTNAFPFGLLLRLAVACLSFTAATANAAQQREQASEVPIPVLPLPPPFHFSDPATDREDYRLHEAVNRAMDATRSSFDAAGAALRAARGSRPGSRPWLRARDAVERAIRDRRPVRAALSAYIWFLREVSRRAPPQEARVAAEFGRQAEESLLASSDRLIIQLALLAGIPIGQWPP